MFYDFEFEDLKFRIDLQRLIIFFFIGFVISNAINHVCNFDLFDSLLLSSIISILASTSYRKITPSHFSDSENQDQTKQSKVKRLSRKQIEILYSLLNPNSKSSNEKKSIANFFQNSQQDNFQEKVLKQPDEPSEIIYSDFISRKTTEQLPLISTIDSLLNDQNNVVNWSIRKKFGRLDFHKLWRNIRFESKSTKHSQVKQPAVEKLPPQEQLPKDDREELESKFEQITVNENLESKSEEIREIIKSTPLEYLEDAFVVFLDIIKEMGRRGQNDYGRPKAFGKALSIIVRKQYGENFERKAFEMIPLSNPYEQYNQPDDSNDLKTLQGEACAIVSIFVYWILTEQINEKLMHWFDVHTEANSEANSITNLFGLGFFVRIFAESDFKLGGLTESQIERVKNYFATFKDNTSAEGVIMNIFQVAKKLKI